MAPIIVCGLNGAGKSTLARILAQQLGWMHRDAEMYWFSAARGDPFAIQHTPEEAEAGLLTDLAQYPNLIFSSVDGRMAPTARFGGIVYIQLPRALRLARVRQRSLERFGDRARPGGDLYEREEAFYRLCAAREDTRVMRWMQTQHAPVLTLDGTQTPEMSAQRAMEWILRLETMG